MGCEHGAIVYQKNLTRHSDLGEFCALDDESGLEGIAAQLRSK